MHPATRKTAVGTVAACGLACGLACGSCRAASADEPSEAADRASLAYVNETLNHRIVFMSDLENWHVVDHWATPLELFARGAGDCEDYAIAKYFALVSAGVPAARLRLAYTLMAQGELRRPHMVLVYLANADAPGDDLVLDSVIDEIEPLSRRADLQVLISFDTDGVWRALERGAPARDAHAIRPWARVLGQFAWH